MQKQICKFRSAPHSISCSRKTIQHIAPKSTPNFQIPLLETIYGPATTKLAFFSETPQYSTLISEGVDFFLQEINLVLAKINGENARNQAFSTFHFVISHEPFEIRVNL
jgi:hypothetical protein